MGHIDRGSFRNCRRLTFAAAVVMGALSSLPAWAAPKTHTPANTAALTAVLAPAANLELGDTIVLTSGTTYTGPFTLPNVNVGTGYITIQSSAMASLPGPGVRVKPLDPNSVPAPITPGQLNHQQHMPKIIGPGGNSPAFRTVAGAHHYKLVGLEVHNPGGQTILDDLFLIGNGSTQTTLASVPHNIIIDRCYVHGPSGLTPQTKRGITIHGANIDIINSHISHIYSSSQQSMAIGGFNGVGPYNIINNYLSSSGEDIISGGGNHLITGVTPSNFIIKRNHIQKDPLWGTAGAPGAETCNHIEFKSGKFIVIEGNLCENNWDGFGHSGVSIVFKASNMVASPWCVTEDSLVQYNIIRNVGLGVNWQGDDYDAGHVGSVGRHVIRNNLFYDIKTANGVGRFTNYSHGPFDITVDHNTAFFDGTMFICADVITEPTLGFTYINNLTPHRAYGAKGSGTNTGNPTLNPFFKDSAGTGLCTFLKNVMVNETGVSGLTTAYSNYPGGWSPTSTAFPANWTGVVVNKTTPGSNFAGWKVVSGSAYDNAGVTPAGTPDNKDIGCDIDAVVAATANCVSGTWPATLSPAAYDSISYLTSLNGKNAGEGFTNSPWTQFGTQTNPAITQGSMPYTDTAGNLLVVNGNKLEPAINSRSYRNLPVENQFVPVAGDVLWVSFRINHTGTGALPSNHAGFALYSSLNADPSGDEFFMGNPGFSGQNWGFNPEGGTRMVAPGTVQTGAPRNVLLLYKLVYTSTGANVSMWINPNITSEASLGGATLSGTQPGLDAVRSVLVSTGATASGYQLDELRIGRTFSSVAPK